MKRVRVSSTETRATVYLQGAHLADWHAAGQEAAGHIGKTERMTARPASDAAIACTGTVDRVYENTDVPVTIHDGAQGRVIRVVKRGSHDTVVWNPWHELPDVGEWDWHEMVCVETANLTGNARVLARGETHRVETQVLLFK